MKTVLVPTAPHDLMTSVFETALHVARRFDSYIEGFALRPTITEYIPVDMVGGLNWVRDGAADEETARESRRTFESFFNDRGLPRQSVPTNGPSFGWLDKSGTGDEFVGHLARIFDVAIVGRPGGRDGGPRMITLEAALFESGRPLVIAPPTPPASLGKSILIAWNGSTETARCIALAMPLLAQAERVVVLSVEGGMVPGPTGEELARSLRLHGFPVEATTVAASRRSTGEAILANAASLGSDLVVKGAYTQSRLRQMIFGGATSHLLAEANLPVFMSH